MLLATKYGSIEAIRMLLYNLADPNIRSVTGQTVLSFSKDVVSTRLLEKAVLLKTGIHFCKTDKARKKYLKDARKFFYASELQIQLINLEDLNNKKKIFY